MADPVSIPPYRDLPAAPFIYFDVAPAFGVVNGVIEIEVAARTLIPTAEGSSTQAELVTTGRLRCSPHAAVNLREGLDKAIEMFKQLQEAGAATAKAAAGKLN